VRDRGTLKTEREEKLLRTVQPPIMRGEIS
jgi:hypothetical protein